MDGLIALLGFALFIGVLIVLDKRSKRIDAERLNSNKCCNSKKGCGKVECDDDEG